MNAAAQIVHEAETQRQHIRLNLPAQVDVNGEKYDVKDISSGGLAIRNANDNFKKNQIREFVLHFPFSDFELDIELRAEILHIDQKENIAGCRFIDLTEKKISILNHVIKSFMSGDLINAGDIIDTVSRENFVSIRKQKQEEESSTAENIKKYTIYGAIAVAIILLASFMIQNVMDRLFVINSLDGVVQTNQIEISSGAAGTFSYALAEGRLTVSEGQTIGSIEMPEAPTDATTGIIAINNNVDVISPCDCTIIEKNILNNQYTPQDKLLFTLIPQNADVTVSANLALEDIHRLNIGSNALIRVMGENTEFKGKIIDIKMNETTIEPSARAIIKTNQSISADLINRPASIEFHL